MSAITGVYGREILDSRGNPTVEVEVQLESGAWGRAAVPSGASTGKREAVELRDGDTQRYGGKGVSRAVSNVEETIAPEIDGMEASEQAAVDQALLELEGTPNKSALGANAILAVSLPVARAAAGDEGGFAPALGSNTAALDFLMQAIERAGYRPGDDIALALDVAASEFAQDNGRYRLRREGVTLDSDELISRYEAIVDRYPVVSIEDGLGEDDCAGWAMLTRRLCCRVQRAHRQVQPAAAHRGRARPRRLVARAQPLLPHRPVSGRPRAFGVAAVLLVAVGLGAYGMRAVLKVSEMRREMDTMERDLVTLRARTDELTRTVERLRNDPAYIEKLAREDLGYVREGETVLKFPSQTNK